MPTAAPATPVRFEHPTSPADLLRATPVVRFLDVPERDCLMVDGHGAPEDNPAFIEAMGTLYPVAWTLHFLLKRAGRDDRIGPLEGLWAPPPGATDLLAARSQPDADVIADWPWTLCIGVPAAASRTDVEDAIAEVRVKKALPALERLRVQRLAEGPSAQILHLGPYSDEGPTIGRLHQGIQAAGLRPRGAHHEIYLGDPRRSAPERLRTIIRQPVA